MKIAIGSSEVVPFAKTGGLADVAGALPKALEKLGHEVVVILPYYKMVKKGNHPIKKTGKKIYVQLCNRIVDAEVYSSKIGKNVKVYFIAKSSYYNRNELYRGAQGDYKDNAERFIFFSKAILSLLEEINFRPDIIHCNDWQTGLIPVLLKTIEKDNPFLRKAKTVFTIHNLAYQGLFWHYDMHMTNLPWDVFTQEGIEFYGKMNLLKAGIVYSDKVNTVSKKYAEEIQTTEYGCGLEGVLANRKKDLRGILNGVDYDEWSPEKDKFINSHFSSSKLSGKLACKKDLLKEYGLDISPEKPLIGVISRLADQKGFDILAPIMEKLMGLNLGFILLGTGEEKYHRLFSAIGKEYPKKAGIKISFDIGLSHRIEAGCDMFLMPSLFEPCGLNQIYSLKYGTIPIVRATGGLDDTIKQFDVSTAKGNGFKFTKYSPDTLLNTIQDALSVYNDKALWHKLVKNAMKCDFSWNQSAKEYEKLYKSVK
ncbi:MAG: glycogen synthase GlgA [Candidatus Theseobacter exili]|nr:glycogen synthase GlgA [Candidatus Theseobacter exili]